jgi:hypothetical protein
MSEIAKAWTSKKNGAKVDHLHADGSDVAPFDLTDEFESLKI